MEEKTTPAQLPQTNGSLDQHAHCHAYHGTDAALHEPPSQQTDQEKSCLQKVSNAITGTLEAGFERLGLSIGTHPWRYILGCVVACSLCGLGLISFSEVTEPEKLWVPQGSQVVTDKNWIDTYYLSNIAREQIIAVSANILTPTGVSALLDFYQSSLNLSTSSGVTLDDVCVKSGSDCMVLSILEIWSYDNTTIRSLTQEEILLGVNNITISPLYGSTIDISDYLGAITRNATNDIISAEAATITWLATNDDTTKSWELEFLDMGKAGHTDFSATYVLASRSWKDVTGASIQSDISLLTIGYVMVIIFVIVVLGKFNLIEQRAWLTAGGFACIGLSVLVSVGFSSAIQQEYGPIQSILPFLLLGIGVDDMFVIMGALNNLDSVEQQYDIPHKIGDVLRHAGVSITVTSFTDFIAFFIGATTVIPALRSFCIYAGVGIIALYLLQAIFFTSCLTIDLKRIQANRDACCFMINHGPNYKTNACSQKQLIPYLFKRCLAKVITKLPFKIVVTIAGLALFAANVYGLVNLKQYFDPNKYLPFDSYAYLYAQAVERYFPDDGAFGYVYCGDINYWSSQTLLENLNTAMENSPYIANGTTDSWFLALTDWLDTTSDASVTALLDANNYPISETAFINLTYRLTTEEVTRTSSYVKFNSTTDITASRFPFRHISMDGASTQIEAMDQTRELVQSVGFSTSECFAYSTAYRTWETNKILRDELYRNLGIAVACVFVITLILIANIWTSLMVFLGVTFTLVDVAGTMYFWGLTIETVTSIVLILSIGLAVDYSAHIGHMFMTVKGDKNARTKETIGEMGPPVFYGGFSTFMAFILLASSNSYVFQTFFKVNFLVVLYGLFHGLVFLPVILSWLGPDPYPTADRVYRHHHPHHTQPIDGESEKKKGEGGLDNPTFTDSNIPPSSTKYSSGSSVSPTLKNSAPHQQRPVSHSQSASVGLQSFPANEPIVSPPPEYSSPTEKLGGLPSVHT